MRETLSSECSEGKVEDQEKYIKLRNKNYYILMAMFSFATAIIYVLRFNMMQP